MFNFTIVANLNIVHRMTTSNQQKRHTGMSLGNIIVSDPVIKDMTLADLKEMANKEDPELYSKLRYYTKQIDGSDQVILIFQ